MLKFSILSSVWILTILLFVTSVVSTKNLSDPNTTDYSLCYNHQNHGQVDIVNCFSPSFTHPLQVFIHDFLKDTCNAKDKINDWNDFQKSPKRGVKTKSLYSKGTTIPNSLSDTISDYVNGSYCPKIRSVAATNSTLPFRKLDDGRSWKRRTLCSIFDDEKYSAETASQSRVSADENQNAGGRKTLADYDESNLMYDMEDSDSLKAHIRVKRSEPESDPRSFADQDVYLKDLANSFPHNSYDSIDENSYEDEPTFDAKREIKLQDLASDDALDGSVKSFENDQSKVSSSSNDDESAANVPSRDNQISKLVRKSVDSDKTNNQETSLEEPETKSVSLLDQRSENLDSDASNLPEDPMLAVELVRKKRDDYGKTQRKENLVENSLSGSLHAAPIDPALPGIRKQIQPNDNNDAAVDTTVLRANQPMEPNAKSPDACREENRLMIAQKMKRHLNSRQRSASMAIADFKADLLRFKRRAKHDHEKTKKKKRKRLQKKHASRGGSLRSQKTGREKNAIRSIRERKIDDARADGKSNVGIHRLIAKRNNPNNFRRRSVIPKNSIETNSANDRSSMLVHSNSIDENIVDDGSSSSSDALEESDVNGLAVDLGNLNENQPTVLEAESAKDGTKLRAKREKSAEMNHGFLNEEDELRYYENIHESEPRKPQCANQDRSSPCPEGHEAEGGRASRSIEEVKDLAKKLVTKVGELENFLSVAEAKENIGEKRIQPRAIDDLCSDVTPTSAILRETPKFIQRCVPFKSTMNNEITTTMKTVANRRAEFDGNANEVKHAKKSKKSTQKKRSARERLARTLSNATKVVRSEGGDEGHKWGRWTDWSSCSVTCGKGRQIRWRYCLHDCSAAETEMEEKACQLPACPPGKFLGIF